MLVVAANGYLGDQQVLVCDEGLEFGVFLGVGSAERGTDDGDGMCAALDRSSVCNRVNAARQARGDNELLFDELRDEASRSSETTLRGFAGAHDGDAAHLAEFPDPLELQELHGMASVSKSLRVVAGAVQSDAEPCEAPFLVQPQGFPGVVISFALGDEGGRGLSRRFAEPVGDALLSRAILRPKGLVRPHLHQG